jgi:hypothetical protein
MMNNKIEIAEAIQSLNPQANHRVEGADLDEATIDWLNGTTPISKADIQAEMDRLQVEYDALDYARKRKDEYPDIYDYIDGVVKSDQAQIDKYIADCQAVKDKYSKGA